MLRRGVVPGLAGRRLVVPDVLARIGAEGDDRREEEVVTATRRADRLVPRRPVADADVEQIELRVMRHRVPDRPAAAAEGPPLAVPGLRGPLHGLVLEAVRRIARDGVEAPGELAGRDRRAVGREGHG